MDTYCSPIVILILFALCVLILGGALVLGLQGGYSRTTHKPRTLDLGWILISLLMVAVLAMLAFLIYALSGFKPC
jgi:heme/copper-type cytochrome/quinol oxidase subunit 2